MKKINKHDWQEIQNLLLIKKRMKKDKKFLKKVLTNRENVL